MLNQGYGWASDVNLKMIFDALFSVESGVGYPAHRQQSQQASRRTLEQISSTSHLPMHEILKIMPKEITTQALSFPGIYDALGFDDLPDSALKTILSSWR